MRVAAKFEAAWHYGWAAAAFLGGFRRRRGLWRRRLPGARRQRDMGMTEQSRDHWRRVGAEQPIGAVMAEARLLQPIEIAQHLLPLQHNAGLAREIVEMLLHRKSQEGTEHMAADRGVGRMENRPCAHDRLGAQEEVFDLQ